MKRAIMQITPTEGDNRIIYLLQNGEASQDADYYDEDRDIVVVQSSIDKELKNIELRKTATEIYGIYRAVRAKVTYTKEQ